MKLKADETFEIIKHPEWGIMVAFCKICGAIIFDGDKHLKYEQDARDMETRVRDYMHRTRDK